MEFASATPRLGYMSEDFVEKVYSIELQLVLIVEKLTKLETMLNDSKNKGKQKE
jgi:hypothetical protein